MSLIYLIRGSEAFSGARRAAGCGVKTTDVETGYTYTDLLAYNPETDEYEESFYTGAALCDKNMEDTDHLSLDEVRSKREELKQKFTSPGIRN